MDRTGRYLWAVLLLTLMLSAVLAWEAQRALHSQRRAAELALRDYARFAGWEFKRQLAALIENGARATVLQGQFAGAELRHRAEASPGQANLAEAASSQLAWCDCADAVHDFFSVDLLTGTGQVTRRRALPAENASALLDSLIEAELALGRQQLMMAEEVIVNRLPTGEVLRRAYGPAIIGRAELPGDGDRLVIFSATRDAPGTPTHALGYIMTVPAFVAEAAASVLRSTPLLPPSLTKGSSSQEVLRLVVRDTSGAPIYASDGGAGAPTRAAVDTVRTQFGDFVMSMAVRPEFAQQLIIGGLPRSRLPLIGGLFALTLVLTAVAFLQARRREQLHRLRADFISGTSHELRTPLSQISMFSELLETEGLPPKQRAESLRIIRSESQRLSYMVENILRFARADRYPERMRLEEHDIGDAVRSIVEGFAPLARARGALLRIDAPIQPVFAMLDLDATRQVLLNLLDNAVKYGPRRQTISIGIAAADGVVSVWLDDEGPGIPEAERSRVWEPYRRLERDRESPVGGSGIGLALVRRLMLAQQGRAQIKTAPGGGTRMILTFSCAFDAGAADDLPASEGA